MTQLPNFGSRAPHPLRVPTTLRRTCLRGFQAHAARGLSSDGATVRCAACSGTPSPAIARASTDSGRRARYVLAARALSVVPAFPSFVLIRLARRVLAVPIVPGRQSDILRIRVEPRHRMASLVVERRCGAEAIGESQSVK